VEVVIADREAVPGALAEDPVAAAWRDPAKALHVDVDQLARPLPDIADRRTGEAVGVSEATEAIPTKDAVHGRARVTEERSEAVRANSESASGDEDPTDLALGQGPRPTMGSSRAVLETSLALGPVPPQPLIRGGSADPEHLGRGRGRPAPGQDSIDQEPSAERRELGRTMEHESPPSEWSFDNPIPSTRALNLSTT